MVNRRAIALYAPNGARLDEIDVSLLRLLHESGRMPSAQLSHVVALSPSAASQRVKRLEDSGALHRVVGEAAESIFSCWSIIFVKVDLAHGAPDIANEFIENLEAAPEVIEAMELAGRSVFLLRCVLPTLAEWPALRARLDPDSRLICAVDLIPAIRTVKNRAVHPLLLTD